MGVGQAERSDDLNEPRILAHGVELGAEKKVTGIRQRQSPDDHAVERLIQPAEQGQGAKGLKVAIRRHALPQQGLGLGAGPCLDEDLDDKPRVGHIRAGSHHPVDLSHRIVVPAKAGQIEGTPDPRLLGSGLEREGTLVRGQRLFEAAMVPQGDGIVVQNPRRKRVELGGAPQGS